MVHAEHGGLFKLAHQHQALVRRRHHFKGTGLAVAVGVLAGVVHIEAVVGMLDHRHPQAAQTQLGNQLLYQRGFATAGEPGKAYNLHPMLLGGHLSVRATSGTATQTDTAMLFIAASAYPVSARGIFDSYHYPETPAARRG